MTSLTYTNLRATEILSDIDTFLITTLELLKDRTIPLEDRWQLYLKIETLLPIDPYITDSCRFIAQDEVYDRMFPDGKGMKLNSTIDESLMDSIAYWPTVPVEENETRWTKASRVAAEFEKANYNEWREMVLAEGTSGCVFDW